LPKFIDGHRSAACIGRPPPPASRCWPAIWLDAVLLANWRLSSPCLANPSYAGPRNPYRLGSKGWAKKKKLPAGYEMAEPCQPPSTIRGAWHILTSPRGAPSERSHDLCAEWNALPPPFTNVGGNMPAFSRRRPWAARVFESLIGAGATVWINRFASPPASP